VRRALLPPSTSLGGQECPRTAGAAWSYLFLAPPRAWKPQGASGAAPDVERLRNPPFGRAPAGAGFGGGAGPLQERLNTAHTAVSRTKSSKPHPENRHPPEKASTQLTPLAETRRRLQPPRLPPPHRRTGSAAAAIAQAFACRTSLRWLPASAVPPYRPPSLLLASSHAPNPVPCPHGRLVFLAPQRRPEQARVPAAPGPRLVRAGGLAQQPRVLLRRAVVWPHGAQGRAGPEAYPSLSSRAPSGERRGGSDGWISWRSCVCCWCFCMLSAGSIKFLELF